MPLLRPHSAAALRGITLMPPPSLHSAARSQGFTHTTQLSHAREATRSAHAYGYLHSAGGRSQRQPAPPPLPTPARRPAGACRPAWHRPPPSCAAEAAAAVWLRVRRLAAALEPSSGIATRPAAAHRPLPGALTSSAARRAARGPRCGAPRRGPPRCRRRPPACPAHRLRGRAHVRRRALRVFAGRIAHARPCRQLARHAPVAAASHPPSNGALLWALGHRFGLAKSLPACGSRAPRASSQAEGAGAQPFPSGDAPCRY